MGFSKGLLGIYFGIQIYCAPEVYDIKDKTPPLCVGQDSRDHTFLLALEASQTL